MIKYTTKTWIDKAREIHGDRYIYSSVEYVNNRTNVLIGCKKHGYFYQSPKSHLNGCGCRKCYSETISKRRKSNKEEFERKANIVHNFKYDYNLVDYISSKTKVRIICPIHGVFLQKPNDHLNGRGCPYCGGKQKLTVNEFIDKSKEVHGDKYDYSKTKYINQRSKVCIICPTHGEFWQTPHNHLKGQGCPKCNSSYLETTVRKLLSDNNIDFEEQKRYDWLGRQTLDFYLPKYNIGIECQGIQHFKPISLFGGETEFNKIIDRDKQKKKLCKENNVQLLYFCDKKINANEFDNYFYSAVELINHIKNYSYDKTY